MNKKIILIVLTLLLILFIDVPVITKINNKMYMNSFKLINGQDMLFGDTQMLSAITCYILLTIGIYYFSIEQNNILNATILGFIVYGVYNTTNLATINKYSINVTIVDTIWGTIMCTIISSIVLYLKNNYIN